MSPVLPCRVVTVYSFQGDHSRSFVRPFLKSLADELNGRGRGPSALDCLLYAGHAGVSTDGGAIVYGFNPDSGGFPNSQVMVRLQRGDAFPGTVRDDTSIFLEARKRGLSIQSFDVLFPNKSYQNLAAILVVELRKSRFDYGFPDGDGDSNCITWLERIGLPLLTGRMNEFIGLPGIATFPSRRFGECT